MGEAKKRILVIDDEPKIVEVVEAYLVNSGYQVRTAFDGSSGMDLFEKYGADLVVLDLMLPKVSGEEVCKSIRRKSRVPIIMLTAKIEEESAIQGFHIGADDYVTKPFSVRELMARIQSLLRRSEEHNIPLYQTMSFMNGDLEIDLNLNLVKKNGDLRNLTPIEMKLFQAFMKYPQKIFTREELIELALGMEYDGYERTIDSHIKNLRSKIETDSQNPEYIMTVRGLGYKFGGVSKDKE